MRKKLRIYIDTSVIGGCCDEEFKEWSNQLLKEFKKGMHIPVISEITEAEISKAPRKVQDVFLELMECHYEEIPETEESMDLAKKYVEEGILPKNYEDDARHIAIATTNNVDVLVSWNFKHIVHFDKIRRFNSVNLREGYKSM